MCFVLKPLFYVFFPPWHYPLARSSLDGESTLDLGAVLFDRSTQSSILDRGDTVSTPHITDLRLE